MAFYTGSGPEVRVHVVCLRVSCSISLSIATNGPAGLDAIPRAPRRMDKSTRDPRAFLVSADKSTSPPRHSLISLLILSQYIGLQILEKLILTRWKSLPEGQRQGAFIVAMQRV